MEKKLTEAGGITGLKERLLQVAGTMLERDGVEILTLRAVAREAGVSHMAPYRHFENKDALLAAVAIRGFRTLACCIGAAADHVSIAERPAAAMGVAYVSFALDNPALYRLMFGSNLNPRDRFPDLIDAGNDVFQCCIAATQRHMSGGRGENTPVTDIVAAYSLWATVHGLSNLALDGLIALHPKGSKREKAIAAILSAGL